jgi:hypothetical protein
MRAHQALLLSAVVSLAMACDDCSCRDRVNPIECSYSCQYVVCDVNLGDAAYEACVDACQCDCYVEWCGTHEDEDASATVDAALPVDAAAADASIAMDATMSMDAGRTEAFCRNVCAERVNPNNEELFFQCMADCYAGTIP